MNAIYVIIGAVFGIIIIIGLGLELSKNINLTVIYILFWLLYSITILTFVTIMGYIYFYYMMKNKQGPPGPIGLQGDKGLDGNVGKCDPSCRDNICINQVTDSIKQKLQDLNNNIPVTINNVYIKGKIKQICGSNEF
jgi:membrane-bound ClpP family serine protease